MTCWPCERPGDYDYRSMAMFSEWGKLCEACKEKFKTMTKPYVIKEPAKEEPVKKQFLPPILKTPIKNYTEREAGEEG